MMNNITECMAAWRKRADAVCSVACLVLAVMQVLLVLVSWIVNAALPYTSVRSLLGSEGIRWFFGHFTDNMASPLLVWILLLAMSSGVLFSSGIISVFRSVLVRRRLKSRQRFAVLLVLVIFVLYISALMALTCIPDAILLSSTGSLFPSSFSVSLVPVTAFGIMIVSATYGMVSGTISSLAGMFRSMTWGLSRVLPFLVVYVFAAQLYYSLLFVFRI